MGGQLEGYLTALEKRIKGLLRPPGHAVFRFHTLTICSLQPREVAIKLRLPAIPEFWCVPIKNRCLRAKVLFEQQADRNLVTGLQ